jgi:hypothetical protein
MGVANPVLQLPLKQWAIGGVSKFFEQRYVLVTVKAMLQLRECLQVGDFEKRIE